MTETEIKNILLITDCENSAETILSKLDLLRSKDKISVCNVKDWKKQLVNSLYSLVFLYIKDDENSILKTISAIKDLKNSVEILLFVDNLDKNFILRAYDEGITDYCRVLDEDFEILLKTINCLKINNLKNINSANNLFLHQTGIVNGKTNLYEYKYVKEIYIDLSTDKRFQNGVFVVLTLDERIKTKISLNRLAGIIKNTLRTDDISSVMRGGKFGLLLPSTDIDGAKSVISKLQNKIGEEYTIKAGIAKNGIRSIETIEKYAQDSLTAAIQNELPVVCLEENGISSAAWLDNDEAGSVKKPFKIFKTLFNNKLENIIIPLFYRYQKDFETSLANTIVSQYANEVECMFCLKGNTVKSELSIHYDGFTKLQIEITHSGLNSPENTKAVLTLKEFTDKILTSYLKQLKNEYKKTEFAKGE